MIFTVYFTDTHTGDAFTAEYDCMDACEAEELFLNDFGGNAVIDGIDCAELCDDYDDSMDGDHESALASAGFGTDEDYGYAEDVL